MALSDIRTKIKSTLESVSGIGPVHDYPRHFQEHDDFKEHYTDEGGRLNTWTIESRELAPQVYANRVMKRMYEFTCIGYYARTDDDESRKTFEDLVSEAVQKLYINRTMNSTSPQSDVVSVDGPDETFLNQVHCYTATIIVEAEELDEPVTWT